MLINHQFRDTSNKSLHDTKVFNTSDINRNRSLQNLIKNKELKLCLIVFLSLLIFTFLICVIAFIMIPLIFMHSIQLQRFAMFPAFWHILPYSLASEIKNFESSYFDNTLKNKDFNVVLYFHGNSGNRISPVPIYHILRNFFHVIAFDYRGYGDSTSATISEEKVVDDCVEIYKWLLNRTNSNIFVWGHSLGAALACNTLAKLNEQKITAYGLILEAPFNNMAEEVFHHPLGKLFSWLPWFKVTIVAPLLKNGFKFETNQTITLVNCPILILHAEDDGTVPTVLVEKLVVEAQSLRNLTYQGPVNYHEFLKSFNYGHHKIYEAPELSNLISEFVDDCNLFWKFYNQ